MQESAPQASRFNILGIRQVCVVIGHRLEKDKYLFMSMAPELSYYQTQTLKCHSELKSQPAHTKGEYANPRRIPEFDSKKRTAQIDYNRLALQRTPSRPQFGVPFRNKSVITSDFHRGSNWRFYVLKILR